MKNNARNNPATVGKKNEEIVPAPVADPPVHLKRKLNMPDHPNIIEPQAFSRMKIHPQPIEKKCST